MGWDWDWYKAADLYLMEKQGKEETRMQQAEVEGLKCWRNTPRRTENISDSVLEDASGVEGRRKGFWVHICVYDVKLGRDPYYDQNRHDLYNLGPKQYQFYNL
ncbi:hypothetical protein VE02_08788 [Pseudogymnoascus sp. 03VT05]|nr:hypothetical protein VE02_08788 [Pseudogymnoascus sp. 03VT05]